MTALEHNTATPSTDLTNVHGQTLAQFSVAGAREAMTLYREISEALLTKDDVQEIRTRKGTSTFPKRSAFQKLANAYRVSTEIVKRELTHDDDGNLTRCDVIVRATHPDGRYSEGDGACSASEDRFARNRDKIDHDLPATAVTRAKNRAISDLVAFGAVSAEEAETTGTGSGGEEMGGTHSRVPSWAAPVSDVGGVAESLVRLLKAAGVEKPAEHVPAIGDKTVDRCDDGFPLCVWQAINDIADELDAKPMMTAEEERDFRMQTGPYAPPEAAPVDVEATSGTNDTNDEGTAA